MPRDQRGKRRLGTIPGVLAQQGHVIVLHSPYLSAPNGKGDSFFCSFPGLVRQGELGLGGGLKSPAGC
jgi:hypothetical protein